MLMPKRVLDRVASATIVVFAVLATGCGAHAPEDSKSVASSEGGTVSTEQQRSDRYIDRAQAQLAVDMFTDAVRQPRNRGEIEYFMSSAYSDSLRSLSTEDFIRTVRSSVLRDGMAPNISNLGVKLEVQKTGPSFIGGVAYYDREISPGLNHENVSIELAYEAGRWKMVSWNRSELNR